MHRSSTNNPKFDKRILERLEQSITSTKALYKKDLIEICIFGSYARGKQKRFSTIDMFVILESSDIRFLKRNTQLERILNEEDRIPQIDPLVYTHDEIIELIHKKESFIISMLKESIVIWHKQGPIKLDSLKKDTIIHSRFSTTVPELKEAEL